MCHGEGVEMASVDKLPSGKYRVRWRVDGKAHSRTFDDFDDARMFTASPTANPSWDVLHNERARARMQRRLPQRSSGPGGSNEDLRDFLQRRDGGPGRRRPWGGWRKQHNPKELPNIFVSTGKYGDTDDDDGERFEDEWV
jgi:hypothetical protein